MATLGTLVGNSLWFAFDALDYQKTGEVPKSQLKVLTQNIGVLLGIGRRVENCISDFLSIQQLNYEQFLYFLIHEVFAEVDDELIAYSQLQKYHDALESAFWVLGRSSLLARPHSHPLPVLEADDAYKVFRVFCMLADRHVMKAGLVQVALPLCEVEETTRVLQESLGRDFDPQDFSLLAQKIPVFSLPVFFAFLEGRYLQEVEPAGLADAVEDMLQAFVGQVLERGKLYQRMSFPPVWVPRDLEVVSWEIRPVKRKNLLEPIQPKGLQAPTISLTPATVMYNIVDEQGTKPCRFTIETEDGKQLQFAATNHRMKTRWLRAIEIAIQHSYQQLPYQLLLSAARKQYYLQETERQIAEKIRRDSQADIIEQTQAELVSEKMARAEAEAAVAEEAAAKAAEEKRVKELTEVREKLQILLQEEMQAKRDEEIVRNLQARVLREEWEKREELEALQEEQRQLLEEETKKRKAFQKLQEARETQLREAEKKLRKLESDRRRLDHELRCAREKIVMSERGKEVLEASIKVKERTPPARTLSLRPTKGEKGYKPTRSSSFNTHYTPRQVITKRDKYKLRHSEEAEYSDSDIVDHSETSSRSSFVINSDTSYPTRNASSAKASVDSTSFLLVDKVVPNKIEKIFNSGKNSIDSENITINTDDSINICFETSAPILDNSTKILNAGDSKPENYTTKKRVSFSEENSVIESSGNDEKEEEDTNSDNKTFSSEDLDKTPE